MEDNTWLKLYRKLLKSPIFENEKALKIWIWCLLKATHIEREQLVGHQIIQLEKGQFIFGRKRASEELGMSESTIYKYINLLKELHMITISSNNKFSVVSIEKWGDYQVTEKEKQQQRNNNVFFENNNKLTAENIENRRLQDIRVENSNNKYSNNKITGYNTTVSTEIENIETAKITTKEQQSNTNKNVKNIYLYLLNKYRVENRKNFNEYMQKTRQLREDEKWTELSREEQNQLMSEI